MVSRFYAGRFFRPSCQNFLHWAALLPVFVFVLAGCAPSLPLPTEKAGATATTAAASTPTPSASPAWTETIPVPPATSTPSAIEISITPIPLEGEMAREKAEISGMAWYGDMLVLLPQYPTRHSDHPGGALFAIPRAEILAFLDGEMEGPLVPLEVPFSAGRLHKTVKEFEGFEAILFAGDQVYLLIEAEPNAMASYLVRGQVRPELSEIVIDTDSLVSVPLPVQINNFSNEALVLDGDRLFVFYEGNGAAVYENTRALVYSLDLQPLGEVAMPPLEYRLTDATPPDTQGRFWVTNYFFPGEITIYPTVDPLVETFGAGRTHARSLAVERLVELQLPRVEGQPLALVDRAPVQLELSGSIIGRNWEGIARLDSTDHAGFLIVTDKHPATILAFVPFAGQ